MKMSGFRQRRMALAAILRHARALRTEKIARGQAQVLTSPDKISSRSAGFRSDLSEFRR